MLSRFWRALWRMRSETRAVAATEFALLLPMIVLLYAGAGQLSQAAMTSRKVELLSRTIADLVAQQPTFVQTTSTPAPANAISQQALQSVFNASLAVMAPGSLNSLKMTVSAIDIVNKSSGLCCDYKVRWSYTQSGTQRPCAVLLTPVDPKQTPAPTTISSAMAPPVTSLNAPVPVIIADIYSVYQGPFSTQWVDFTGGMKRTSYMLPRTLGQVILKGPINPSGNQSGTICY